MYSFGYPDVVSAASQYEIVSALLGTPGAEVYVVSGYCVAVFGSVLVVLAWRLWRESSPARAGVLFHFSLLYLALLFVAVAIDAAVR